MQFQARQQRLPNAANGRLPFSPLLACALALAAAGQVGLGQTRLPATMPTPSLPEPIYWKQDLFLVPYQWRSAAEAGAAQAVWLFVSRDRGATWQKISEAKPNVTSFNYRAPGDGEYWFAVRTVDRLGRTWPAGPYHAELRVVVDTMMPQLREVHARQLENGTIEIVWSGSDANLDAASLKVESQTDPSGAWQLVPPESLAINTHAATGSVGEQHTGQALWTPPSGTRPLAVRATIFDRAGNPASYQTQVTSGSAGNFAAAPPIMFAPPTAAQVNQSPPAGWVSGSTATAAPAAEPQPWPGTVPQSPFRLFSGEPSLPDDGVTAYGDPPAVSIAAENGLVADDSERVAARYASRPTSGPPVDAAPIAAPSTEQPSTTPPAPIRQAAILRLPPVDVADTATAIASTSNAPPPEHSPTSPPKLVGTRTFALEYDVDDMGRRGVTKVELWGTRDGGRTWHSFALDDDQRSPLVATVDEEGLYGFRIVVESAGTVAQPPRPGDEPELWVSVDLQRPVVELTAIERGAGNLADHLILRWRAVDDNLQSRPISLFYSSRSAGPWSVIATNLQNTGDYPWRVERHVPTRFYLRLEARDTAGNLAAFQTREPIEFSPQPPAEPTGPTATGIEQSYR